MPHRPIGPPQNQPSLEGFTTYGDGDPTLNNNVICAVVWSALIVSRVPKLSGIGGENTPMSSPALSPVTVLLLCLPQIPHLPIPAATAGCTF